MSGYKVIITRTAHFDILELTKYIADVKKNRIFKLILDCYYRFSNGEISVYRANCCSSIICL